MGRGPDGTGDSMTLTQRQSELREEFTRVRGTWSDAWESVLRLDPDFLESYLRLSAVPWEHGVLDPKIKEFVYIAADANATHMYEPGVRRHIARAIELGATADEIMQVLELISTLGIHAATVGVPILLELLAETGQRDGPVALDGRRQELKAESTRSRGYWDPLWDGLLELAPDFFAAYLDFSSVPWRHGVLEPKVKEFIYISFDAAATHLYQPGLKVHMRNALRYGASAAEIMEILEIVSVIGIHASALGAPILEEQLGLGTA